MRARANTRVTALLLVAAAALCASAPLHAATGGGGLGGDSSTGRVQPGDVTVSASGGGITLATRASGFLRHPQIFSGKAGGSAAGERIEIERRGRQTDWRWQPTAHSTAHRGGSFTVVWPANHIGRFAVRAVIFSSRTSHAASSSPSVAITVYRTAIATLYGPGFWGSRTACGKVLRRGTLGVANRTLPCGSRVSLYYAGRTIVVPVIDRGPYANHADWDLTMATGRALGLTSTARIGAVPVPRG